MSLRPSEHTNQRFEQLSHSANYNSMKQLCESRVAHWRWATWQKFDLVPFDAEKNRFPKGRWLNSEPDVKHDKWLHGFDEEGRIVVIRGMCELPGVFSEQFYVYSESTVERTYCGSVGSPLVAYACLQLCKGIPFRLEAVSTESHTVATYTYIDNQLVAEHLVNERFNYKPRNLDFKYRYYYDSAGRLSLIECTEQTSPPDTPATTSVVYRRPQKGLSKRDVAASIAARLVQLIPEKLRASRIQEPVFNLLIVYDNENFPLPPLLALGSESLRQRAISEHGKDARYDIWNPADYSHFNIPDLELSDPELLEACDLLNQRMAEADNCQLGRQLLNSVAAQLQKFDWTGILHATEDFVVCAVDLESQDDLQKNIKKSVPSELIKKLKREGLL